MSGTQYYSKDLNNFYPSSDQLINYPPYYPYNSYFNLMYQLKFGDCNMRQSLQPYKSKARKTKENNPQQLEKPDQASTVDPYKVNIIEWLKGMSTTELFKLFMIKDRWFANTIIKMYWKYKVDGDQAFALYSEEDKKDRNPANNLNQELDQYFYCRKQRDYDNPKNSKKKEAEQEVLSALRIIDNKELYDTLCLSEEFVQNIDHLIDIFEQVSDNNLFLSVGRMNWDNTPIWFNSNSFQTIATWIVSSMERVVTIRFCEEKNNKQCKGSPQLNQINCENLMEQKASLIKFWKALDKTKRKKILNSSTEFFRQLSQDNQNQQQEAQDKYKQWFKKKLETHSKRNQFGEEEIQSYFSKFSEDKFDDAFIDQLSQASLEDTCSIISIISKKIFSKISTMYSEKIAADLILNEEMEKSGKKKQQKKKKKNKKKSYLSPFCQKSSSEEQQQLQQKEIGDGKDPQFSGGETIIQKLENNIIEKSNQKQEKVHEDIFFENPYFGSQTNCFKSDDLIESCLIMQNQGDDSGDHSKSTNCCCNCDCKLGQFSKNLTQKLVNNCIDNLQYQSDFFEMKGQDESRSLVKKVKNKEKLTKENLATSNSIEISESQKQEANNITTTEKETSYQDLIKELEQQKPSKTKKRKLKKKNKKSSQKAQSEQEEGQLEDNQKNFKRENQEEIDDLTDQASQQENQNNINNQFISQTNIINKQNQESNNDSNSQQQQPKKEIITIIVNNNIQQDDHNNEDTDSHEQKISNTKKNSMHNQQEQESDKKIEELSNTCTIDITINNQYVNRPHSPSDSSKKTKKIHLSSDEESHIMRSNISTSNQQSSSSIANNNSNITLKKTGEQKITFQCVRNSKSIEEEKAKQKFKNEDNDFIVVQKKKKNKNYSRSQNLHYNRDRDQKPNRKQYNDKKKYQEYRKKLPNEKNNEKHNGKMEQEDKSKKLTATVQNTQTSQMQSQQQSQQLQSQQQQQQQLKQQQQQQPSDNQYTQQQQSQQQASIQQSSNQNIKKDNQQILAPIETHFSTNSVCSNEGPRTPKESKKSFNGTNHLKSPLNLNASEFYSKNEWDDDNNNSSSFSSSHALFWEQSNNQLQNTQNSSNNILQTQSLGIQRQISIDGNKYIKLSPNNIAKKIFQKKVNNDISKFVNNIQQESEKLNDIRYIAYNRIRFFVSNIFGVNNDTCYYGSCMSGLALPTSDIDIGITGFEQSNRQNIISVLRLLLEKLSLVAWAKSIEPIFTATIPIIKLEVDPNIHFKCYNYPNPPLYFIDDMQDYKELNLKDEQLQQYKGQTLKVDITVECYGHLGNLSLDFMMKWLDYYPTLTNITILLKAFLNERKLNNTYKGGISSYCLLIMIIAYYRDQNLGMNKDQSQVLIQILNFYGNNFYPENQGISLALDNPFFELIPNAEQSKLQVHDPLTSKIITQKSNLIDKILKEFQEFYDKLLYLKRDIEQIIEQMEDNELNQLENMDYDKQKECFKLKDVLKGNVIQEIIMNTNEEKLKINQQISINKNNSIQRNLNQ